METSPCHHSASASAPSARPEHRVQQETRDLVDTREKRESPESLEDPDPRDSKESLAYPVVLVSQVVKERRERMASTSPDRHLQVFLDDLVRWDQLELLEPQERRARLERLELRDLLETLETADLTESLALLVHKVRKERPERRAPATIAQRHDSRQATRPARYNHVAMFLSYFFVVFFFIHVFDFFSSPVFQTIRPL